MITYPCAKINLGLNVVSKRTDGYHDIETIFYPIPLCDKLEVRITDDTPQPIHSCDLNVEGNSIECNKNDNLVVKAYNILAKEHDLPNVHADLHKNIPSQAGLGGGSSDAAYMLRLLNELCHLGIENNIMEKYAVRLGADCAFFVTAEPAFATGIGDILSPVEIRSKLHGCFLAIVKPDISISTKNAYAMIVPKHPDVSCRDVVRQPMETWKHNLGNDFELPAFTIHPELSVIKQKLYDAGAVYAQMSGSGSAFFGIFKTKPENINAVFPQHYNIVLEL